jgi:DNA-binding NtrC family response regulator
MCAVAANMCRVLYVDDNENTRGRIAMELERCGYKATVVTSGNRAKVCLRGARYLAIVSEFNMRDGTGADLFHYTRSIQPKARFIFFTSQEVNFGEFEKFDNFWGVIKKTELSSLLALLKKVQAGAIRLKE